VLEDVALGVPEIDPLVWLSDSPEGSEGEIDQEVAGDPELRGVILVMAMSL
jgi:hypothetical protein